MLLRLHRIRRILLRGTIHTGKDARQHDQQHQDKNPDKDPPLHGDTTGVLFYPTLHDIHPDWERHTI